MTSNKKMKSGRPCYGKWHKDTLNERKKHKRRKFYKKKISRLRDNIFLEALHDFNRFNRRVWRQGRFYWLYLSFYNRKNIFKKFHKNFLNFFFVKTILWFRRTGNLCFLSFTFFDLIGRLFQIETQLFWRTQLIWFFLRFF